MSNDSLINVHPLLQALLTEAENRGIDIDQMCAELSISRVYFNSLHKGHRDLARCRRDTLQQFADFLGKSLTEVELLAGAKDVHDFVRFDDNLDRDLNNIWHLLKKDNRFNHLATASLTEFQALPRWTKVVIAMLYHSAAEAELGKLIQLKAATKGPASKARAKSA